MEIDWDEVLKVADQMGIKYEMNSKTPGLFVTENGIKKQISVEELFKEWTDITYNLEEESPPS